MARIFVRARERLADFAGVARATLPGWMADNIGLPAYSPLP